MGDQNFRTGDNLKKEGSTTEKVRAAAGDAFFTATDTARDAGEKAKRAASDTASSMTDGVMGLLNDQIGAGAESAGRRIDRLLSESRRERSDRYHGHR